MNSELPAGWDKKRASEGALFLQSSAWAEFQTDLGYPAFFLEGEGWSCLLIERRNRLGRYLFAPYGPTLKDEKHFKSCLSELAAFSVSRNVQWLKIEPVPAAGGKLLIKALKQAGFRRAAHDVNPHLTRLVGLSPPEDDILATVSQSTRSLIRKNLRQNTLRFKTSADPGDIPLFITMLHQVVQRNKVHFFDDAYFAKQARILMPKGMMFLELAYHQDRPVGAAIIHDFGGQSSYTYAASMEDARKLNSSALLLWQCLVNAKARGNQKIDLYGVAPDDAPPSHPWYGFSAYKRKFGGEIVERSGTWDLPLSKRYGLYRRAQSARRALRR